MRKFVLIILIIYSSCASYVWAVSQEQYDKYYTAQIDGDFNTLMEVVTHIFTTKDPAKLTVDDYEILSTGLGFFHQFGYEFSEEQQKAFTKFFEIPEGLDKLRTLDILYFTWYSSWENKIDSDSSALMANWDSFASGDVEGGMSPEVHSLVNWRLAQQNMYAGNFVAAELRMLEAFFLHGKETLTYPWEAVLFLSRASHLYHSMGKAELAISLAEHTHELIQLLPNISHLYLQEIVSNLVQVATLHGHTETAALYLSILDEKSVNSRGAINQQAELVLSTMDAYIAIRTLDRQRAALALERYNNSGWKFESINGDYFFQYMESYIAASNSKNCSSRVKFDSGQVQDQSIGNVMRIMEIDALSFCGEFRGLEKLLTNLTKVLHASTEASYDSLSRALEPYAHSIWAQEVILKALFRAQQKKGYLNKELTKLAIDFFLKSESSPAERELEALRLAKLSKSPRVEGNIRAYFNLLRERDIYLSRMFYDFSVKVIKRAKEGYPADKTFINMGNPWEYNIINSRNNIESYITELPSRTVSDIQNNISSQQGAIFSIDRGRYQLSCFVSRKSYSCETLTRTDEYIEAKQLVFNAIKKGSLLGISHELDIISKTHFPPNLRLQASKSREIFYVPMADDWRIPLNLLWEASGIPGVLIISPTLSSLSHKDTGRNTSAPRYSYTGIGDPNYNVQSITSLASLTEIKGFSLRSAGYIEQLSSLSQLPSTRKEIEISRDNFKENARVYLGSDASEDNLMNVDWYDSEIIHFATHALITGEMKGLEEPAIALSRPTSGALFDGLLTATDIRGFNFPNSTIVLSGCRTATDYGKNPANGITGLSLAFLTQGANNLVVTQWQVPDESSSRLVSNITQNLSVEVSANSLQKAAKDISVEYSDPFDWAAYVFVSIPDRYNRERKSISSSVDIESEISIEGMPIDVSHRQVGGANFIGVSTKDKSTSDKSFKIYQVDNNEYRLISSFYGYTGWFIDSPDGIYAFLTSDSEGIIVEFDKSMSHWDNQIQLFHTKDKIVYSYPRPKSSDSGFIFAYKAVYPGEKNQFVKMLTVGSDLKTISEQDITSDVFGIDVPKHYIEDSGWHMSVQGKDVTIAISRRFNEPFFEPIRGSWEYPVRHHTYFYDYRDGEFESVFLRRHTKVLGVMDSTGHTFIAAAGKNEALALVSAEGKLIDVNEELAYIDWVLPFQYKNNSFLSVSSSKMYSENSYFKIFESSLDLVPVDVEPVDGGAVSPDSVVETIRLRDLEASKGMSSEQKISNALSFLRTKRWIYQNSIVKPSPSGLGPVVTFPSTPIRYFPVTFLSEDNSLKKIDIVNFDRLESRDISHAVSHR